KYMEAFQKLTNPLFQERVFDIKDVFRRALWHLRPGPPTADDGADKLVLVAYEASVMDLFSVDLDRLAGVVVESGGPQSHAAILARSLNIPMVGQVPDLVARLRPGRSVRVDGTAGLICLDPGPQCISVRDTVLPDSTASTVPERIADTALQGLPRIEANNNLLCELRQAVEQGASGVGLYRSEFLFLARRTLPTEEEQVGIYRKLLLQLNGRPVSIRTFDLRPDKLMAYSHLSSSTARPFDWRLVLDSPPLQQLFADQV